MSTATATSSTRVLTGAERRPVWRHGAAASVAAAIATTTVAAVASAAGVSFADRTGSAIPTAGFAQLTLVFSLIGVALAAVLARKARRPRSTFVRTTVALTVLSLVPDATFGFGLASAATLMALHMMAAVIVIPVLARRLAESR